MSRVPILGEVGEEMLARLSARSEEVGLRAGRWLFREGDPSDSMYLVVSGRLEARSGTGELTRALGRGDPIGELGLLTGAARSASVRARRDSLLLRVSRDDFEELVGDPSFTLRLLRSMGAQLRASREVRPAAPLAPAAIAVAGTGDEITTRRITEGLRRRFEAWGAVGILEREGASGADDARGRRAHLAERLDQLERTSDRVLLVVDDAAGEDDWTTFCLDQADRALLVTDCSSRPPGRAAASAEDLLLWGDEAGGDLTSRWIEAVAPHATYRVHADSPGFDHGLDRVARRLSGRSIGIVLSGGGARGFAHIGALEALRAAGVEIDRVGGCSMGALVGALYASGLTIEEIRETCHREVVEGKPMSDYTIPVAGLIRRGRAEAMLRRMFGDRQIEALELAYFCVSADLVSGDLVVHTSGPLFRAVGASICLPGLSPPVPDRERLLIDGGILNNLPVETMSATGDGPTIAIDVTARYTPRLRVSARPGMRKVKSRLRELVIGDAEPLPPITETLFRTIVLGSADTAQAAQEHADLVIEPEVDGYGLTDFDRIDAIVEAGRVATEKALEGAPSEWFTAGGAASHTAKDPAGAS